LAICLPVRHAGDMASVARKQGGVGAPSATKGLPERRRAPRRDVLVDVVERTNGATYFQRTKNVSTSGLHIGATLAHPPGTRVSLSMKLPGEASELSLEGEVVARHPEEVGMAVRFIALTERERAVIAALVRPRSS
jgi:hypothetical protein